MVAARSLTLNHREVNGAKHECARRPSAKRSWPDALARSGPRPMRPDAKGQVGKTSCRYG